MDVDKESGEKIPTSGGKPINLKRQLNIIELAGNPDR